MKILYLATILVVALSITLITELPHVQASEGHVLFMKTNSIGKIFANFTFPVPDNRTWNLSPSIYLGLTGSPVQIDSNNMTIVAEPNSFVASKKNITVTYTITAKNNTKGIFALFLYFCGESPLIVGLNESEVSSDVYNQFFNAVYGCPALTDSTPTMNIIGYSNMISKSINIDSNNTMKVKTLEPFNNTSPVLKNSIITTNSSNSIPPIPSSILHSPVPTLSPSENQTVVSIALSVPELHNWSHDWKYLGMGFGSNNKAASGDFEWQYASVVLKAPSSSAPITCSNDWQATVVIDMTTMKVVSATYPTMESHPCEVVTLGEPATSSVFADHFSGVTKPIFYSTNGTALLALKAHEKVNITFTAKINDTNFDGHVFYNIIEGNNQITESENFTGKESPKNFTFSYTPQKTGIFEISNGIASNSSNFHEARSQGFIVLENFSKATKFNGQCKQSEYNPVAKPDFSTNACVKLDTYFILKQRGWH